jgi:putative membrane protein
MWNDGWTHYGMMSADGAAPWLMVAVHSLLWALLFGLAIAVLMRVMRGRARGGTAARQDEPLAILDSRYARGEIDRGEYLERRGDLS